MKKSFWIAGAVCMLVFGEAVYAMTRPNVNHSNTNHQYCNVPNCPMTGAHVHEEHHANRNNTHGHHHGHGNHY